MTASILGEPEQARLRVAGLRARGERADLDETEAEAEHLAEDLGILVESCGEADRIGEGESGDDGGEHRIGCWGTTGGLGLQRPDRQPVRPLRIEREGEGPKERVEGHRRRLWHSPVLPASEARGEGDRPQAGGGAIRPLAPPQRFTRPPPHPLRGQGGQKG